MFIRRRCRFFFVFCFFVVLCRCNSFFEFGDFFFFYSQFKNVLVIFYRFLAVVVVVVILLLMFYDRWLSMKMKHRVRIRRCYLDWNELFDISLAILLVWWMAHGKEYFLFSIFSYMCSRVIADDHNFYVLFILIVAKRQLIQFIYIVRWWSAFELSTSSLFLFLLAEFVKNLYDANHSKPAKRQWSNRKNCRANRAIVMNMWIKNYDSIQNHTHRFAYGAQTEWSQTCFQLWKIVPSELRIYGANRATTNKKNGVSLTLSHAPE